MYGANKKSNLLRGAFTPQMAMKDTTNDQKIAILHDKQTSFVAVSSSK